ncbi:S-norcoclaurine synthase [Thalictrum thalictroides]|uniref:S-norcoclaurine synthase n=1 Tax=Thalictrum thalictroides TaxID=46969 RepID=A0A7J6W9Q0_THATH|nr:S-norcoclaurine synthase [Thalictrum thalictroides]
MAFSNKSLLVVLAVFVLSHLGCEALQAQLPGSVISEFPVPDISAEDVWALYSSPELPTLIVQLMPSLYKSIDVMLGNGTEGTILKITLQPTNSGPLTWHERFVKVDHKTRTKVVRQMNGGFLNMGFTLYEDIFEIKSTGPNSCVIRATVNFIVLEESRSGASIITADWSMAYAMVDYIRRYNANNYLASKTDSQ